MASATKNAIPARVVARAPEANRLDGRVALVTGAGRGTGRATALLLAARGARVVVSDVDRDVAEQTAAEIGDGAIGVGLDVGDAAAGAAAVAAAVEAFGRLDVLAHVAGLMYSMTGLAETDDEDVARLLRVNVQGPLALTRAALPHLLASDCARVLFVSSQWGQVPDGHSYAYMVAKAGQLGLMKTLAQELTRDGILVNAVTPGAIRTRLVPEQYVAAEEAAIPVGRLAEPEEIAAVLAFLASDEAAFIAGQAIPVNGGALVVGI